MSNGDTVDRPPHDGTVPKRRKLLNDEAHHKRTSAIFAPFRTIGLISSTAVPFTSLPLGKTTFQITTSVGRCLHTYDLRRGLNLVFITRPQTPSTITATCAWKDRVFAAWGGENCGDEAGIWIFKRGRLTKQLELPKGNRERVLRIIVFGSWIVGCGLSRIEVWKSSTYEHYTSLTPSSSRSAKSSVLTGDICNMPTFLNKICVGRRDGSVEIWNLRTGKLIYTMLAPSSVSGSVTALEPSPALSILAVARADGTVALHNVRTDVTLLSLNTRMTRNSTISSISFRTDGLGAGDDGNKQGIMATGGAGSGDVTLWDLNKGGRVRGILRGAHNPSLSPGESGGVNRVQFLPGQDVMITSGMDNALKSWIFDANSLSPTPRLLHSRCGHAAPVTRLCFVPSNADGSDAEGKWLMSAGRDQSLWGWSLRRDGQSTELSQGSVRKKAKKLGLLGQTMGTGLSTTLEDLKAPEITSMACSLNRDGGMGASAGGGSVWTNMSSKSGRADASETNATGWESVITAHRGDKHARTWFWGRKKAGRWAFESGDGTEVTAVAITACGTFALVGSAGGSISMFNLQSGIQRQKFPAPLSPAQARKLKLTLADGDGATEVKDSKRFGLGQGKHTKAVTGLMVDSLNQTLISCGLDGKVKFWAFMTGSFLNEIDWAKMTSVLSLQYHRHSELIGLSCDDLSIRVIDTETKKLVRELWGCLGQINDFCFSNDGRWIIAASMDSVIRVWDLPTGHLINALRLESPCITLAFSDTGEFLATAHADSVGINIWNNRTLFTYVPTRLLNEDETTPVVAPTTSGEGGQGMIDAAFEDQESEVDTKGIDYKALGSVDQISSELISLSLVPKSRWQTLLHLDIIRQRNKPKEPPKAPEKAPFFLPSLDNAKPSKSTTQAADGNEQVTPFERSRILKMSGTTSTFTTLLNAAAENEDYDNFISHLSSLPPSAADVEIRSLTPSEMVPFVHSLTFRLRQKRDYELIQAWMAVFLRLHGDVVVTGGLELRQALKEWRAIQEQERARLADLVGYCAGVVSFLKSGR
ncbi:MAG: hypothetical protein Q9217_002957 [Psora testacea]